MRYIRTEDGIKKVFKKLKDEFYLVKISKYKYYHYYPDCKTADTIEELCDEFVFVDSIGSFLISIDWYAEEQKVEKAIVEYECMTLSKPLKDCLKQGNVYGAIWTDKGLQFVARMNSEGALELL